MNFTAATAVVTLYMANKKAIFHIPDSQIWLIASSGNFNFLADSI